MKHILNYGMGVDSTAILLRWLLEPECRDFDLADLVVLTAQTGNEYPSTKKLVERFIYPLLNYSRIRTVQVAKSGNERKLGYSILADTTTPIECHIDGDYGLIEHLMDAGTQPQRAGAHTCAQRWKGEVLDSYIKDSFQNEAIGPYIGYAKGEERRSQKCSDYICMGSSFLFPLQEWGWDRAACIEYIRQSILLIYHVDVIWEKSCCYGCPFQKTIEATVRWDNELESGAKALLMEFNALAMNPRQDLFSSDSAYNLSSSLVKNEFLNLLSGYQWAVYRVERIYRGKTCSRRLKKISHEMSRVDAEAVVIAIALEHFIEIDNTDRMFVRAYSHRRDRSLDPTLEGFWVAAPAISKDKVQCDRSFTERWNAIANP